MGVDLHQAGRACRRVWRQSPGGSPMRRKPLWAGHW